MPVFRPDSLDRMRAIIDGTRRAGTRGGLPLGNRRSSEWAGGSTSYLDVVPEQLRVEIGGTWIGRPWWRTAINTEAKLLLRGRAFDNLGARRVSLKTDAENPRSQATIERLGALREGALRAHIVRPDGTARTTVYFSLLCDEWPAARRRLADRLRGNSPGALSG